jgi:hypothetical protein
METATALRDEGQRHAPAVTPSESMESRSSWIARETRPRPYGVVVRVRGLTAEAGGRTLLAGVCLAGEWLRLTPSE